jgi:transketolase
MAKATRAAFGEALVRLGASHDKVVVFDADLAGSVQTKKFGTAYPDRFFQLGIAEGNMVSVAAGAALCGMVPFAASFAAFIAGRFEQIRMSVGYSNANVCIVGTHSGIGIGEDGYSQMAIEDLACMRSLPNMVVIQPGDAIEAERATEFLADYVGPSYLRLTRQSLQDLNDADYVFEFGKGVELREGSDLTIIATGGVIGPALGAADALAKDGVSVGVVNIHTIKPLDDDLIRNLAAKTGKFLTVEDHGVVGGLGSAVLESLAETPNVVVKVHGVRTYGESGTGEALYAKHGLDAAGITSVARDFLG